MKLPWLSALVVLGVALAVRAKEEESDHLQDIHEGRQIEEAATDIVNNVNDAVADVSHTVFPNGNPLLLAIGNIAAALNLGELIDLTGGGAAAGGAAAAAGGAAAAAGGAAATALAAASTVKSAVLSLLLAPLDLANGILAIIALVLLIVYLVETEGDIKGLVGGNEYLRREYDETYDSYSNYVSTARALWDAPIVQRLATVVQDAIIKYD